MSPKLLKRFIILMALFTAVMVIGSDVLRQWAERPPGDMETELGTLRLEDKLYDEAMAYYDKALELAPKHRGAMMGRALVHIQTERYQNALAELTDLIAFLKNNPSQLDATGRGVLAAAHANRGIVHDRMGSYRKALNDYVESLKTDEDSVSVPGVIHKILYGGEHVSSVRKRARYIYEQLQKPEAERLMRVPEIDALQRMHRP